MATPLRKPDSDVEIQPEVMDESIAELRARPWSVSFFQAVRLLRRAFPRRGAVGEFVPPSHESVRFQANPTLAFPASEIQSLDWPEQGERPAQLKVNFLGLCSPSGVMPVPYTELILDRAQKKDNGFRDFLDIFNHRLISLFYRAWEKYRFFVRYERREPDSLTPLLMSFVGIGTKGLAARQEIADESLLFYAGLLGQRPRSALALKQLLADYFGVPVEVEQFVGKWIRLEQREQTEFKEAERVTERLGFGAVVGDEVWNTQSTARVKLGPLTRERYLDFLPRPESKSYRVLQSILNFYCGTEIDFEVQLVLDRNETPGLNLSSEESTNSLLGWTTWIKNAPLDRDPAEAVLQLN